ncbi:hypothetical protein DICVIV_12540 [Dictyocaulus viviparus]|uniref:RRM domain-containing protein n=2 Tax=Metastrongylidae TaxID=55271 RepID=A0A0D8XGH8_DICVI|nr:hypothetical protein DICVIV_12540 [Dictyocaulus viviparus]
MFVPRKLNRVLPIRTLRHLFRKFNEKEQDIPKQGLFDNPLLKSLEGFAELNKEVRLECSNIVNHIISGSSNQTTVKLFDDLSNAICKAADLVECVRQLHSDQSYVEAAQKSASDFCELVESLNTSVTLYHKLKESKEREVERLDDVDKRTIDLFLNEFKQSGVHLPEEKEEELLKLVCYRDELARLTGYPSYAHRAQENSLLGSYEGAHNFLWGVNDRTKENFRACRPSAERELAVLMDIQSQCNSFINGIGEWDLHYLSQIYKERAYGGFHHRQMNKFLTLGNLINGLTNLVNQLYGVRISQQKIKQGEIWPGSIIKLGVFSSEDDFLGTIYLDVGRRSTKTFGDCHFTVRCSKQLSNDCWQTPVVVLSLSIGEENGENWKDFQVHLHRAENVFHEMGHAMHSMLGRTKYQHIAGTRCPQDFSEIPSILMEYFFNDLTVLRTILRDANGECIPVEDAACMIASRFAFSSLEIMQQASYALFDLELHAPDAARLLREGKITTTNLFHSIVTKALPHVDRQHDSAFQHRFHHLVQYGAKYYSYLIARSAASLIWNSKFRDSPFNRTEGERWMKVQSHGGGLPPTILLESMLGYSPTSAHFIEALKKETSHLANLVLNLMNPFDPRVRARNAAKAEMFALRHPESVNQLSEYRDQRFQGTLKEQDLALRTSTTLYVGNLSFYTSEDQLYELFNRAGEVKRVIMGLDRFKKSPCGFCFIIYYTRADTENAVRFLNRTMLDGRMIRVDYDAGFVEGRQYGRGKHGGQVRDEYREQYDPDRGGFGKIWQDR